MKLRIISGEFKGRFITVPKSDLIRPTADRVRETLFNILSNEIEFENIKVLDLYSGSGSLGIECLSRGAAKADFVENNFLIYQNLKKNIEALNLEAKTEIYKMDAIKFSKKIPQKKYDLFFADPPYFKNDIYQVIENLKLNKYFVQNSFMIIERSIETKDEDTLNFSAEPFKIIGSTCLYKITPQ
ncbi:MAG: 16S rRNA (guanine(966)-N(2))-methyltransferase RsmD [Ignavibacteriaceae bacterium]